MDDETRAATAALTRRQRQAALTRSEILAAARKLFAVNGFRGTSVKDIAEAAGVAVQTVYDSVGSKASLVLHLNDLLESEAGVLAIAGQMAEETDPAALVALPGRVTRAILEHCGDIVRTCHAEEVELGEALREGRNRHRGGVLQMVHRLREVGALGLAVDVESTADTVAVLTDVTFGLLLLDDYGWSLDRMEDWMTAAVRRLVLQPKS